MARVRVTSLVSIGLLRSGVLCWLGFCLVACSAPGDSGDPDPGQLPGMRLSTILGAHDTAQFAQANVVREFVFPQDHGAHESFRSEWWYLTSVLQDEQGNHYGVQFTLFRQALGGDASGPNPWQTGQIYMGHLGVTDVARSEHHGEQRFARGHTLLAGVQAQPFKAYLGEWQLNEVVEGGANAVANRLGAGVMPMQLTANGQQARVTLQFNPSRPLVLQGDAGLSHKGADQASYYYSMPRLQTTGTLNVGGRDVAVTGTSWLDREWSTSVLGPHLQGWDWFALQLDDGRDIMAFRLRRHDGQRDPYDHGLLLDKQGQQRTLGVEDFVLTPINYWTDAAGSAWPIEWQLRLDEEVFRISAMLDDQLMDLGVVYWEGLVSVRREAKQEENKLEELTKVGTIKGYGYMELTGYRELDQVVRQ